MARFHPFPTLHFTTLPFTSLQYTFRWFSLHFTTLLDQFFLTHLIYFPCPLFQSILEIKMYAASVHWPRLTVAKIYDMFSIAIYDPDSCKFAKAANLLEILSWYCSPNFHIIYLAAQVSVHTKLMCCSFTYQQSLSSLTTRLISSTISSQTDWMSGVNECHLLLSIINLILSLPIGRDAGVLWMFLCKYIMFITPKLFDVAKFPTQNTLIITMFMYTLIPNY
jgi:hypothetical protein